MQALLRKGADPNAIILQDGSRGNSPLHFACMLEKPKHAELLLMYGANPYVRNEFGMHRKLSIFLIVNIDNTKLFIIWWPTALELVPKDAVRSTKLHFKKIFDVSTCYYYFKECFLSFIWHSLFHPCTGRFSENASAVARAEWTDKYIRGAVVGRSIQ